MKVLLLYYDMILLRDWVQNKDVEMRDRYLMQISLKYSQYYIALFKHPTQKAILRFLLH